jgi:iron(III) transport system substrate-binding protein
LNGKPRFSRAALFVLTALAAPLPIHSAMAADDWDEVVAQAKKEGTVVVHGAPGVTFRAVEVTAFNKAYPDIKVQFSGVSGATEVPKVIRERQAGIFAWDIWIGGASGALGELKDIGFFQPLAPALRPDIRADDKWVEGFDAGWLDREKKFYYGFDGTIQNPVMVNYDFVPKDSIKSLADLASPAFAGKIIWFDPRVSGTGNGTSQTLSRNLGNEDLVKLYQNKIVYTTNSHQLGEWVVRGRYPIGIGLDPQTVSEFQAQGLGMNIGALPGELFKIQQISVGFGGVGLVDRAPHINAAKVYVNWLLSKEGQEAWSKVPRSSRRSDVVPVVPELTPKPGVKYFIGQSEELSEERRNLMQVAKDAIGEVSR